MARVERARGVNANQVFTWRRQYQRGMLGGNVPSVHAATLLAVRVADAPAPPNLAPLPIASPVPAGTIHLQLPRGRLRIEGAVGRHSLRLVLEIPLPAGTQICIAAGVVDLRRGFTGLSAIVKHLSIRIRSPDTCSSFATGAAT